MKKRPQYTKEEDWILLNYHDFGKHNIEEIHQMLPHRSMQSLYVRNWRLRKKLEKRKHGKYYTGDMQAEIPEVPWTIAESI